MSYVLYFFSYLCYNKCKRINKYTLAQEVQEGGKIMNAKAAAARREYKRKWARENPEKVKAQQERYWTKKAEQAAADEPAEFEKAEFERTELEPLPAEN